MGWTSYIADCYKNGKIDRKEECRREVGRNPEWATIVKDAMVGATYYAAMRFTRTGEVFGLVLKTSVDKWEFYYKDMSEDMGPCECDCPAGILRLLSPTDNEFANEWRARCWANIEAKKARREAQKDTYFVALVGGRFEARKGELFHFYLGHKFVKAYFEKRGGHWTATDGDSGILMGQANTKDELTKQIWTNEKLIANARETDRYKEQVIRLAEYMVTA